MPDFSLPPSLPGILAAEPDPQVVEAVARAMGAEVPLSNLYFHASLDLGGFAETLAMCLRASAPGAAVSREAVELRASYSFRAEHDPAVRIWHGGEVADWTLIVEESSLFATPPARRTLFLKPWPEDPAGAFRFVAAELPGVLVFPGDLKAPIAGVPVSPMLGA